MKNVIEKVFSFFDESSGFVQKDNAEVLCCMRYGGLKHYTNIYISKISDTKTTIKIRISDMDIDISRTIDTPFDKLSDLEFEETVNDMICEREDSVGEYGFTYRK